MDRCPRQSAYSGNQFFAFQLTRLIGGRAAHQLRERRRACHRRHAAFGAKADFVNPPARYFKSEFENIATSGILNLNRSIRRIQNARIARMLKVIENLRRVHAPTVVLPTRHSGEGAPSFAVFPRRGKARTSVRLANYATSCCAAARAGCASRISATRNKSVSKARK